MKHTIQWVMVLTAAVWLAGCQKPVPDSREPLIEQVQNQLVWAPGAGTEIYLEELKFEAPGQWHYANPGGDRVWLYSDEKMEKPQICVARPQEDWPPVGPGNSGTKPYDLSPEEGQEILLRYGLQKTEASGEPEEPLLTRWEREDSGSQTYLFRISGADGDREGKMEVFSAEDRTFLIFQIDSQDEEDDLDSVIEGIKASLQPSGLRCYDTGSCG